jgi:serine/threonine-protein kinase
VVAERFRVEQVLGCGAMAWVLSATHVQRGLPVALIFLRFEATRQIVDRFFPAGRDAARSSNDAPGRVLDVDRVADETPFLVMESLEGFELQKMIDDSGWLPVNTAVDFAIQACEGIAQIHGARIVRRDVLRTLSSMRRRTGWILGKRIAFGVSKLARTGSLNGSEEPGVGVQALARWPIYTAPERMPGAARSAAHMDACADIWSLGVLLYELLGGGCSPFEAATLDEVCSRIVLDGPDALNVVRRDLPLGLETVVYRCLEKDPTRRYPDAQSLAIALAPYASRSGQLRARRLQHSRPQGHGAPLFNPRRSLPPILPPPRQASVPALPGPTGTVRLLAGAPDARREPRAPPPALTTMRMPSRPMARPIAESPSPPARVSRHDSPGVKPRFSALFIGVAVALSVPGGVLGTAVLAIRAQRGPAPHVASTAAGIANHMPGELPAPVTIAPPPPEAPIAARVEAPVETEHVYAPEELPLAARSAHAAPVPPSGKTGANRVGPDGF